jgi:hypothetical protein
MSESNGYGVKHIVGVGRRGQEARTCRHPCHGYGVSERQLWCYRLLESNGYGVEHVVVVG